MRSSVVGVVKTIWTQRCGNNVSFVEMCFESAVVEHESAAYAADVGAIMFEVWAGS